MANIGRELDVLSIGTSQHFRHLTVFPLVHPTPRVPFYLTLDEALAQGTAEVTEVSKGGHVPELRLSNKGDRPVQRQLRTASGLPRISGARFDARSKNCTISVLVTYTLEVWA